MKDQLDYWLSKVTMYRLVTLCLLALLAEALLMSAIDRIGFTPWSLLISIGILLASVYGSSRLFGWLFNVRPHGESSIITALILACLFFPPVSILAAVKLVLVGCFASASKYVIAVRGRHIFNPAATAAVIASVSGLMGAGWWIATPTLLPMTLLIAFLILYKTRRLQIGVLFIMLATTLVTISMVMFGTPLGIAIITAVSSWPIIFLAGVMLSEPLTQPPRRWQQLVVTALIAVLMIIPLRTPIISMTPALALLVGNAVSWYWGSRRALKLKFIKKIQLTPSSYEFVFAGNVPFVAGQYIELTLPHHKPDSRGMRRMFTIAASPGDKTVRFGIKIPEHHSTFKQALTQLEEGTVVTATRVAGDFILPKETAAPILFVAGGIGITPLISYVRSYKDRNIVLVYAVSSPAEIAYRDVLAVAGIRVVIVTPNTVIDDIPGGWEVIEGVAVTPEILEKAVPDIHERMVYISGPPLMVNAVKRAAKKLDAHAIKTDHFAGY